MTADPSLYTGPCLLHLLQPIRHRLHTFIDAKDAMCLMRAGRSTTAPLLTGYGIFDIEHASSYDRRTVVDVKRSIALFARYDMRILAMQLPCWWNEPLLDAASGESVLPASLIALVMGRAGNVHWNSESTVLTALLSGTVAHERSKHAWDSAHDMRAADAHQEEFYQLMREVGGRNESEAWSVASYDRAWAPYNEPIPPGALPRGLRFLQLNSDLNQPLQLGSIPDTVEVLQFGIWFNRPLGLGHLPASLTQLNFGGGFRHPLRPGVLPAGLRRLHLGEEYAEPLSLGALPSQLEELCLGSNYSSPLSPGVIPSSVRYLRLSHMFNQPLQPGAIPQGVHHLDLGRWFDQPLPPGVLPSSLRQLRISRCFNHPLQPGSLPYGLELLSFDNLSRFAQPLQPGVIPASVIAVSLGQKYKVELLAGSVPGSVRWARLPDAYYGRKLTSVLSPWTRVLWHEVRLVS